MEPAPVTCKSKLKVLHENGNHGRADDSRYVAHHPASFITETAYYDTSRASYPYRYEGKLPFNKAGSPNILVHVVAMYDAFQAVLGFLSCHVLG